MYRYCTIGKKLWAGFNMDEEIFHVEDFDPYEWIENRILDCEDKSDALHSLLPELTLLSQSLTKSIHITLHQVNTSIPQIQNQLELLERLTVPLTQRLDTLSTQINIADNAETHVADGLIKVKDTEKDLNHLMILHEAKHRLTSCKSALLEAAKWEKNVRLCYLSSEDIASVQDRFTKSNALKLKSISERMEEMKRSLEVNEIYHMKFSYERLFCFNCLMYDSGNERHARCCG
jgi:chromosome segregation ATPase